MSSIEPISLESTVVAAKGQISSQVHDEVVILDLQRGEYHGLEGIGPRVWELLQKPLKVRDIRDIILSEYDVPADVCEKDLLQVLSDLKSRGLVDVSM